MSVPHGNVIPIKKGNQMSELNKAWRDIYYMLEDNAFDYVGKPFVNDNEGTLTFEGRKYAEVPF
jgi:hypothetical protein